MKKLYSLFAAVVMAATMSAQGSETFETQTALTGTYSNGTFSGETSGVTVNYQHSRDESDYAINGKGIMLRRADEPSYVEFVIPNGVGTFKFDYRKAFTGASDRILAVLVDGTEVNQTPGNFGGTSGADATVYNLETVVNKDGQVTVRITYPSGTANGNRQAIIDNVSWTVPIMAVSDVNVAKLNFVKNTIVGNQITFGEKSDVKIINMNGQVVKAASVDKNSNLDVSSLAKGVYIVTGQVDGKAVSQKVVKQ